MMVSMACALCDFAEVGWPLLLPSGVVSIVVGWKLTHGVEAFLPTAAFFSMRQFYLLGLAMKIGLKMNGSARTS
jgi:hypothetical protein